MAHRIYSVVAIQKEREKPEIWEWGQADTSPVLDMHKCRTVISKTTE
jgi:hypothetical protein